MFWKKKFEAIDTAIKDVCSDIQMVEKSVKSDIGLDITELRLVLQEKIDEEVNEAKTQALNSIKLLEKELAELSDGIILYVDKHKVEDLHWKSDQTKTNRELSDIVLRQSLEISVLTKQVNALIETHPNVAMYQGVFNRPEIIKKP